MSRDRFKSLLPMLHADDPFSEDLTEKLWKADRFIKYFRSKCINLFQPYQNLATAERLEE